MPARPAARPQRPFLIMNPRSGGGKVTKFGLKDKAEKLGAQVALLQGPGTVDVAALARKAVADDADLARYARDLGRGVQGAAVRPLMARLKNWVVSMGSHGRLAEPRWLVPPKRRFLA